MSQSIEKVAVLGAGVMGAQIAGHFANAGIPALLFDINQELAQKGADDLTKMKPAPLYKPKNSKFSNHLHKKEHKLYLHSFQRRFLCLIFYLMDQNLLSV